MVIDNVALFRNDPREAQIRCVVMLMLYWFFAHLGEIYFNVRDTICLLKCRKPHPQCNFHDFHYLDRFTTA